MSEPDREGVHAAADLLVREHGREQALAELRDRVENSAPGSDEQGRALEALSVLKRDVDGTDGGVHTQRGEADE